jgi:hypothetical protein
MTTIGCRALGYWRLNQGCSGRRDIGPIPRARMVGFPDIGDQRSVFMAVLTMATVTLAMVITEAVGKAASFTTTRLSIAWM